MMLLIHYLLLALPFFFLIVVSRYKRSAKTHAPPGPSGLPLIGNLHQIDTTNTPFYLWKLSKQYGPLMSMKLGSKPLLVISSAEMAEQVMKTHDSTFSGRSALNSTKKLTYDAMDMAYSPYNDYWKEMRKICILRLFSVKQVQSFRPFREDEVSRMMERISNHASKHEVLNLSEIIMSLTKNLICRVAFGKRCNEEKGSSKKTFDELIREYMTMLGSFIISDYFPFLGWIDMIRGVNSRLENTMNGLDSFLQEIIEENVDKSRHGEAMEHNILSLLLQLRQEKSSPVELTMDHIKGLLLDIFVAGTDTSAITIIWAMVALMKKPNIMKNVQEEIQGLGKNRGLMITQDDIENLPYLKAIIKETLRIHPPTPLLLPRETIGTCMINGYEIQPKTTVFVNALAVARDPKYWKNPDEFFPERFLNNQIDYRGQHFGFIPFGAGRRGCPGISLGIATIELALANLLHSFDWELPPGMKKDDVDTDVFPGLVMAKKNPLYLVATKRHN